jgi:hypothetical protein
VFTHDNLESMRRGEGNGRILNGAFSQCAPEGQNAARTGSFVPAQLRKHPSQNLLIIRFYAPSEKIDSGFQRAVTPFHDHAAAVSDSTGIDLGTSETPPHRQIRLARMLATWTYQRAIHGPYMKNSSSSTASERAVMRSHGAHRTPPPGR